MDLYLIEVLGLISFITLIIFWWLIVLDLDNQKKQKILMSSKVKSRQHKKHKEYILQPN